MSTEQEIIDLVARQAGQPENFSDDAFWDPDSRLIYTTDMLVEGQHFSLDYYSPEDVGWKAAAVNISDIAAMGGRLKYLLISLGLPDAIPMSWIESLYDGLLGICRTFGGRLIGGDTVGGTSGIVINVMAVGEFPPGHVPGRRSQAREGDLILTTGFHGLSRVGLMALRDSRSDYETCTSAHLRPQPRIDAGLALSGELKRYALMDSSDGLADTLLKIARTSGKVLCVNLEDIPVHPEVADFCGELDDSGELLQQTVLYGGEDFELVATVPEMTPSLAPYFRVIGRVEALKGDETPGACLVDSEGRKSPLDPLQAFQHFNLP